MTQERWFRSGDEEAAFDWYRSARELDVPAELARALYMRAMERMADVGPRRASELFRHWLREAARSRTETAPVPGRKTRVMQQSEKPPAWRLPELAPGRWTRAMFEQRELPGMAEVRDAVSALLAAAKGTDVGRAEPAVAAQAADALRAQLMTGERAAGAADGARAQATATGALASTEQRVDAGRTASQAASGRAAAGAGGTSAAEVLRTQLMTAATSGRGAAEALVGVDPAMARAVLRELADAYVPGNATPVLRLVARADDGEAMRLLGRDSSGTGVPEDVAARLGPHVGPAATRAARLHTDDAADLVAAAHHAHAVTIGDEIYFARGAYAPGTEAGDGLLTHELTHVAQGQRGELHRAAAKGLESGGTLDPAEAEAEMRAKLVVIQVYAPTAQPPTLASPTAQPTSDSARQSKIAEQQRRLDQANAPAATQPNDAAPATAKPQTAVVHAGPTMAAAPKSASTGNAYVDTFEAPPSKQALELWSGTATKATTQAANDQAAFDGALQPLPVKLDGGDAKGGAKSGGPSAHTAKTAPPKGAAPPAAKPTPTPMPPPVTGASTAAKKVQPVADKAKMKVDGQKALDALPSTVPDVKTDPGPAPVTDLAGQADPMRTLGDHQHAVGESAKALDTAKAKVLSGPGAASVQPTKLDEKLKVPTPQPIGAMPALPQVDGMAKLKKWNLPDSVHASFDTVAKPKMDASLAQAKAKMTQAEVKRDADRTKAVKDSQDKVTKAHVDADKQQQLKVADSRTQIANHQADTLQKQENEVKKLDKQSGEKKKATLAKVNTRVQADQAKVDTDYQAAEKKAQEQKQKGEAEAAKKKKDAENKTKDQHWWEQAADAVVDGIQAIAAEIDKALDAICKAIGDIIDSVKDLACKVIDAARDFVCQALTEFGDWLKSAVTALLGSVFPELAAALNRLIDAAVNLAKQAVNAIADALKTAVTALCDQLKASIEAAFAAYKAAVNAVATFAQAAITGDWSLVGKMILEGILKLLGIDPGAFYALIGSAMDSIDKIIENPGAFVGHLIDAVKLGFKQFGANFLTHLKDGVVQWLFGTFAQAGITMPATFDVAGVFSLVAQVLGITWPRMRGKVVKVIGEKNTERLEFVSKYIEALMTGGFAGLWEQVQQDMAGLWDTVIGGVKSFLIEKIVQQAILKIATMWNPAGAIIQLIQTAWNVYQWVRENAQRIFGLVQAVVDSIANIVAGNIGGAANFIEASLAKLVPIAISLFANLLGLGGLADKIKDIINKIQTKVDQAIDKLIDRVLKRFKGGKGDKDKDKDGKGKDGKDDNSVGEVINFTAAGHAHRMWFEVKGETATLMVASTPLTMKAHLDHMNDQVAKLPDDKKASAQNLLGQARAAEAKATADANKATHDTTSAKDTDAGKAADKDEHAAAGLMKQLFELFEGLNTDDLKGACEKAGGVAKTKFQQLMGENQPGAAGLRATFVAGANLRLKTAPDKPLDAMRNEVSGSGDKYILKGPAIPTGEIVGQQGVSRVLDLPSVFNYYLKPDYKAALGLTSVDDFLQACAAGKFNPSTDMNEATEIRGKVAESWWFAKGMANGVTLGEIKKQLTVMDTTYDKGMLRIDITAEQLSAANINLHKPTVFDGMMQGWGDDPMWVEAPSHKWGLTRDNMQEGVIKASTLGAFKTRKLILPTPIPVVEVAAKSLIEPSPAHIEAKGALAEDLAKATSGQVLFDNGADAKTATTKIVHEHKDARLDTTTGALTLPPVTVPDASAPLAQVANDLAKQTGVSRVTLQKSGEDNIALRGEVNPWAILAEGKAGSKNSAERLQLAQAVQEFHKEFTAKTWMDYFKVSQQTSSEDFKAGEDAKLIVRPRHGYYQLAAQAWEDLRAQIVERFQMTARREITTKPFGVAELDAWCDHDPKLPKERPEYKDAAKMAAVFTTLQGLSAIRPSAVSAKYDFTPIPNKRFLPLGWTGKEVRAYYFENGSGYTTTRDRMVAKVHKDVMAVIAIYEQAEAAGATPEADKLKKQADAKWFDLHQTNKVSSKHETYPGAAFKAEYNDTSKYHADHIQPLAWLWDVGAYNDVGYDTRRSKCGSEDNLQVMWGVDNMSKGSKGEDEENGKFMKKPWVGLNFTDSAIRDEAGLDAGYGAKFRESVD